MPSVSVRDAQAPLILTLDIGTSSLRVLLFDAQGRQVSGVEARTQYTVHTTPDGGAELDPQAVLAAAIECFDQALAQAGDRQAQIAGVGACSLASSLVGVAGEEAVTPVYIWADTRPTPDAEALRAALDEKAVHDRTGCVIHASYLPARFLWLHRTRPDLLARAQRWMSISEYLYWRLLGEITCSLSIASWTGLLDRRQLTWDREWLSRLPIVESQLSPLSDVDVPLRIRRPEFARRWPALAQVPWFPAVGDGVGSNLGSGCTTPRRIAVNAGTSGAMRVVIPGTPERVPDGLWCYRVDRHYSLLGGALSNVGNVFQWLRQTLQLGSPEEIERHLAEAEPDGHGLTVLPFLAGERAPGWAGHARAAFVGIGWHTRPLDLLQAGLESVAYRFALLYHLLEPTVAGAGETTGEEEAAGKDRRGAGPEVIVSGGAMLSSPAWTQILCDVLGRPVITSAETEATSRGAALLALKALGVIKEVDELPAALGRVFHPCSERHRRYQEAIERQRRLYELLIGVRK
ncbi:MAG: gluconokinase [Anaerolineae bacterium]|nr:gluconokinase [Anaerolineae bacterium]MDW8100488.1 gluconokinase [Anaerolineae bacterium]